MVVDSSPVAVTENKITDLNRDKYITAAGFDRLTTENFKARLAQADLVTKTDFDTKLQDINKRITSNKTKHLLVENELKKLKTFDLNYFKGKGHFEEDGTQNCLVFQSMYIYFKRIAGVSSGNYIYIWKSKGLFDERINSITTSNYSITPELSHFGTKARVKFSGSCLKQDNVTYNHGTIVGIYIIYREGEFSFGSSGFGRNVIIFRADMSSSVHANNKTKNILVLDKDFVQGLENTTIYAEKLYSSNFTQNNKKFCLSLHYNGANSYLLMKQKFIN